MKKIVVIGGSAAGAKAASKAKRLDSSNHIEIFEKTQYTSVSLCGLPYYIEGSVKNKEDLIIRTPEEFLEKGIPVYLNYELEKIIPQKNTVIINKNPIIYDELILALGAEVKIPNIENINANNVFTLRSIDDADKIKEKMSKSSSVSIIGAGYIALELSQAFIKNGLKVNIIEKQASLLNDFDPEFSQIIQKAVVKRANNSFNLYLSKNIKSILKDENEDFKGIELEDGEIIYSDFCIISTGIKPNTKIAQDAGITIGSTGAIYVDSKMRTNFKNIYAAGDCAQKYSIITKKPLYVGLGSVANKEGRVAGINATGLNQEDFTGILASSITGFFDVTIAKTGLSEKRAHELSKEINLEAICATVTKKDKAGYMPDSNNMTIKLIADKRSKELLGAQGVGFNGVASRINTIASLLRTRASIEDLLNLDLPYAPPFSGSVDLVLTCAYKLKELL